MFKRFKSKTSKYIVLAVSMLLIASLMVACGSEGSGKVVGKVGDQDITKDELYDEMVEQIGDQALESLIGEKIVDQELEKEDKEVSEEDLDKEIEKMAEQYGGEEAFEQVLASQGQTLEGLEEGILFNLKVKALLEDEIEVSDEEIEEYFEENKDQLGEKEEVDASHILVEEEDEAKEIKEKLDDGEDFEKLAEKHSIDGSKDEGGKLGFFGKGEMVPEFEEAAFDLKEGEISDVVETENGYHIIKVHEKKEAKKAKLEDHKEEIEDAIM
ncbi:MAG TPA: peptidylprolyl isomerase, partial [Tissierellaceae bacterium]|nr:peptidylprolyl isomerase [Tissierellaceae bacterium]